MVYKNFSELNTNDIIYSINAYGAQGVNIYEVISNDGVLEAKNDIGEILRINAVDSPFGQIQKDVTVFVFADDKMMRDFAQVWYYDMSVYKLINKINSRYE